MIPYTVDRLLVFVSSSIRECSPERAAAREAILSINHEPVLFEDVGARAHPPQEIYRSRLATSHIFVGIYRESYGWIGPGMEISGVEDEFRIATARGIDRLVYVYRKPTAREPRLEALIEEMKAGLTLGFYSDPVQLGAQLRADLTAVVSDRFVGRAVDPDEAARPDEVVASAIPNPSHRFRRLELEKVLIGQVATVGRVAVTGPIGGGKTILTAQVAAGNGWLFVDGRGLDYLDLMLRIANQFRRLAGRASVTVSTEREAVQEVLKEWDAASGLTLVVDGAANPAHLWDTLPKGRRLVIASRGLSGIPDGMRLRVPPLTIEEIERWVTAFRGHRPVPGELAKLARSSAGNPLYLRLFALGGEGAGESTLRELEMRAVEALSPTAREIVSYLALTGRRLTLVDLQRLLGNSERPAVVADQLMAAGGLLERRMGRVGLVHEHFRETMMAELRGDETRLSFFGNRLGRFFERRKDALEAFHVYIEIGEIRRADRIVDRALRQATLMGGGAPAIPVARRQAALAKARGDPKTQLEATLILAGALKQTGGTEEARATLEEARAIADRQGDSDDRLWVAEVNAAFGIDDKTRGRRIGELEALQTRCFEKGDRFGAARTGTALTAEHIASENYRRAEEVAREVASIFDEIGDEYGSRVARLNLASALSGIEGREEEAARVAQELEQEVVPERHPRERAVLCNYLMRRCREAADLDRAAAFAEEAIGIGKQLKDARVIAINRTTLGNIRRDAGRLDEALAEYHAVDRIALESGLQDCEAAANELIASVQNELGKYGIARHHAQHAAAVARLTGDGALVARAEEERALALRGVREIEAAAEAYGDALAAIGSGGAGDRARSRLILDALHMCAAAGRNDLKMKLLGDAFLEEDTAKELVGDHLRVLYRVLPEVADRVEPMDRVLAVIGLAVADVLKDVPSVIQRRIVLQAGKALVTREQRACGRGRCVALAAVLMTLSTESVTLGDVADMAEGMMPSSGLYFKPLPDGAGHWTLRLEVAGGVVLSLVQLDGEPRTAILTTILALLLVGFDRATLGRVLDVEHLPRREAVVNVTSVKDLEAQLGASIRRLGRMPERYAVSESTDVTSAEQPPILVIRAEEFPTAWRPGEDGLSEVHVLLGELLRALVPHLLGRAVERDVLVPKIAATIRDMMYR